jgi:hypothetical protein
MDTKPHFTIRPGRHVGWWIDGRRANGRRFLLWWCPTRRIAEWALRVWLRLSGGQASEVA